MSFLRRAPALVALVLLVAFGALLHPGFLSLRVATDLFSDGAVLGIAALGATCVLVSGGLDLSIGSVMAASSVLLALLLERAGLGPVASVAIVVAAGAACGLAQGACIHFLSLPPFLVTLAGMFLFRGLALSVAAESIAIRDPAWAALSGADVHVGDAVLRAPGILFLLTFFVLALFAWRSVCFRHLHAIGGDERAAFLLGVPVRRTRLIAYTLSGACAALAGVAFALTSSAGSSVSGAGLELEAIAAAVVGGVALGPGRGAWHGKARGNFGGTLLGVLLFGVIADLILFQGTLSAGWTRVAMGGMLLIFLGLERLMQRS
ncbi:MAG TPA: sugar ABC transporter permease YjfF [Planctomycetota bacterium]|nr:sugar ABC transporter permease YjfF [Planctomycetota bacterium]